MNKGNLSNKERASSFLKLVASGEVKEAFSEYVSKEVIHHNPYFSADANSLMKAMEEDASMNPDKSLEIKHTIEENDMVVVHSHMKQNAEDMGYALVHMFRFDDKQIIELWDVGQEVPENSPNENGVF
ncbi:nuclear transport factor 2 family protein [Filobacillus milosensis]|uniref:Nuclear transport factor 2 family protein n=1 Tax=Filobacillus milosensis TaxID=94137 RepID=A0A4Y8ING2_9BACI|nr:nuclear transport factor 2 family protein [Filobacillus milosensis]TFB22050.1 nuclear transport factor 2 family protein [Filobacillus milosensis]